MSHNYQLPTIDLKTLPFDLYSRNKITADIVGVFQSKNNGDLRILEAGGRSGQMHYFLPDHDIQILDIREAETDLDKSLDAIGKYIVGSVLEIPLADQIMDITISMEMLEHISPEERVQAIREMVRVSKRGVIIGFPHDSAENDQAERIVNNYFHSLTGTDHP